jgi:MFS family permease
MTTVLHEPALTPRTRPVRLAATLTILLAAQLMAVLDMNIVNVAAASIRADLHTSGAGLQLVIAGYLIAYSVLLITGARVGSILGPRRVFLAGLATFTLASLACGLASGADSLTAFRFIQGAGAALMIPQVFSIIQRHWTGPARARALGHYGAVAAGGVVLGQILGGVLVTADVFGLQWRSVFFVNVPIGAALLVWGASSLPRDEPTRGRRLDLPGLLALAATVLALVVPLVFGHEVSWPAWCWISLVGSAVLFLGFVAVQRRVAQPLMPGRLFRAPGMLPALGALTLMMSPYGGYLFTVALHLQNGLGFSPLRAGLTFVPMGVCFAIASLNWRRLPARWHRLIIPVALVGATASLLLIAVALRAHTTPGWLFYAAQVPFGLSSGLAYSPTVNQALARVQPADAPDASGLVTTIVQLAQVVGLAAVGSIYLALLTHHSSAIAVSTATFVEAGLAAGSVGFALALLRRR